MRFKTALFETQHNTWDSGIHSKRFKYIVLRRNYILYLRYRITHNRPHNTNEYIKRKLYLQSFSCTLVPERCRSGCRGELGQSSPVKSTKVSIFTMILYNSENSIRDIRRFCRPLFCHSSVVKYT